MKLQDLKNFSEKKKNTLYFDYNIKNLNWFNIGGKSKLFYKPDSLKDLSEFLKLYKKRGKIFILGAGSNTLFTDDVYNGVVVKLGNRFNNITKLNDNTVIAGSNVLDKNLSNYLAENEIGGLEFLSCIPGTVGGGVRMNSGCYGKEFKDFILSIQVMDFEGKVYTIPASKINFFYGDLRDISSLEKPIANSDVIFHVAADYRLWSRVPKELYDSNVRGTENICIKTSDLNKTLIYTSSVATLGLNESNESNEDTPVTFSDMVGDYKKSKYLAEKIVEKFIKKKYL